MKNYSYDIKLYSVFHKPALLPKAQFVVPIQVGTANAQEKLPMLHDDDGDNISRFNKHYSELTACYWIWKHLPHNANEAWGLCHYRRYFQLDKRKLLFLKKTRVYYEFTQENLDKVVNEKLYQKMNELLQTHDLIVQRPPYAYNEKGNLLTIQHAYSIAHSKPDWDETIRIVLEKYPEYAESVELFHKQTKMSYYNMMVAPWKIWDAYLSWMFDIMFEVQKVIPISKDPYQARVFGFISERLHNLFILHNKLRPAYLTVALFER